MSGSHYTKPDVLYLPYNHFHELIRGKNPMGSVIGLYYYPEISGIYLIFQIGLQRFSR